LGRARNDPLSRAKKKSKKSRTKNEKKGGPPRALHRNTETKAIREEEEEI
jgi:hypothetical protein